MDVKEILKEQPEEWLTLQDLAKRWRTSVKTVRRHVITEKNSGIEWIRTKWGKYLARRQSVEIYEQRLHGRTMKMLNPVIPSARR